MEDDFIGKWGPEWTVAHEDKGEKGEEEEEDGRRRIVWFDVLTAITVKTTFFRDGSRALWQKNTPKKGEVVRFFEMLVPIYMHTHSAPHTGVHSSTPITDVVLCSDFLVPMYQTTRRHISDDTNPYLKLGFVYVCMCVCVCVCECDCVLWDFRLQQRWSWGLRSSWVLYGEGWYPVTNDSGQPVKQYGLLDCWRWNQ